MNNVQNFNFQEWSFTPDNRTDTYRVVDGTIHPKVTINTGGTSGQLAVSIDEMTGEVTILGDVLLIIKCVEETISTQIIQKFCGEITHVVRFYESEMSPFSWILCDVGQNNNTLYI